MGKVIGYKVVRVKASIFKKLEYPYFKIGYITKHLHVGEDIYFFKKCYDVGLQPWVDTGLKFGHLATEVI